MREDRLPFANLLSWRTPGWNQIGLLLSLEHMDTLDASSFLNCVGAVGTRSSPVETAASSEHCSKHTRNATLGKLRWKTARPLIGL
jgi:hypothetical protein